MATIFEAFARSASVILVGFLASPSWAQLDPKVWTPEKMLQVGRVSQVQASPDGSRVVYAVRTAVADRDSSEFRTRIFLTDPTHHLLKRTVALTQGDVSCEDPQWSPDGSWIAFLAKVSGTKQLFVYRLDGGTPYGQQVTDGHGGVEAFKWSPDGKYLAFTAKDATSEIEKEAQRQKNDARVVDENPKNAKLWVVPLETPVKPRKDARPLTKGTEHVASGSRGGFDWSPDGRSIVFTHTKTPGADDWRTADLSVVDVKNGTIRPLQTSGASEHSPFFSPDGKSVAFVASDDPPTWAGQARVMVCFVSEGKARPLADTHDDFGRYSELVGWSAEGQHLIFSEIHGTRWRLAKLPVDGTSPSYLSNGQGMSLSGATLNASRTMVGFAWETLHKSSVPIVSRLDKFEPKEIHLGGESIPEKTTEVIRWKSKDGLEIEGLLSLPAGYKKGNRVPTLVVIHGGPMGAFTQSFDGSASLYPVAAFAANGFAVLRPNPRGSSGYGKKFRYANYNDWGGGDYHDIMAGVDHLINQGIADPKKLGVMGWSYGGFMTSWIITQTQRFQAASVGAPVTNLVSFAGTADIPNFLPDYFGGDFWDKFDTYKAHSPMFHVKGVKTPTLIQHGEKDERVPLSQGMEFYSALKRQGCNVKMVLYPRTPHGIEEPRLLLDCMNRNLEWFREHLLK